MKKVQNCKHKVTHEIISAIQYVGDKNKFNICEFLKGKKFQVEFAKFGEAQMKIALGDDDFFNLYEKQWLIKDSQGDIGVCSEEAFSDYYEIVKD